MSTIKQQLFNSLINRGIDIDDAVMAAGNLNNAIRNVSTVRTPNGIHHIGTSVADIEHIIKALSNLKLFADNSVKEILEETEEQKPVKTSHFADVPKDDILINDNDPLLTS